MPSDPHQYEGTPVALSFPFRNGEFVIINGGSTREANYHYGFPAFISLGVNKSMRYAVDIVKALESDWRIGLGEPIYSPCEATVFSVQDGLPDQPYGQADLTDRRGNHLVLVVKATSGRPEDDVYVALLHLKRGSIRVAAGDQVDVGQPLAEVGMSGQSYRPHLHIQAARGSTWEGPGVPMIFDGRFLIKGDYVWTRETKPGEAQTGGTVPPPVP